MNDESNGKYRLKTQKLRKWISIFSVLSLVAIDGVKADQSLNDISRAEVKCNTMDDWIAVVKMMNPGTDVLWSGKSGDVYHALFRNGGVVYMAAYSNDAFKIKDVDTRLKCIPEDLNGHEINLWSVDTKHSKMSYEVYIQTNNNGFFRAEFTCPVTNVHFGPHPKLEAFRLHFPNMGMSFDIKSANLSLIKVHGNG